MVDERRANCLAPLARLSGATRHYFGALDSSYIAVVLRDPRHGAEEAVSQALKQY
jgi:hypothetical protein